MLTLLILKFLRLPLQTRLIAGFSALVFVAIVSITLTFLLFSFEHLSRLPSDQTLVYFHLNIDRKGDLQQIKIIDQLLTDFNLSDLDRHYIGSELAFICGRETGDFSCRLAAITNNKQQLAEYLQSKKLSYQQNNNIFLVGQGGKLPPIKKSWKPWQYLKYQSGLISKTITVSINLPQKFNSAEEKLLSYLPNKLKLSGSTDNNQLVLGEKKLLDLQKFNTNGFDFILKLPTNDSLTKKSWVEKNTLRLILDQSYKNIFIAGKRVNSTGELIDDYQLFFSATNQPSETVMSEWKETYTQIAGARLPAERSTYLNDNTRVRILTPDPDPTFQTSTELTKISISKTQTLYFGVKDGKFIAGNEANFTPDGANFSDQFAFIRISSLPDNNLLKKYFSNFSFIILNNKSLYIE